ncbi:MAG TPA: TdeIII family type II restriction endonuclease [Anaerolineales bacterium]|nr:TdeIII family type II restriction endonuclease [Anaerolineales bacterium]
MRKSTRKAVHILLKTFAQKSLKSYDVELLKRAYPFHQLFFDEVGLVAFKQERSVVTKMGQTLYPELAKLIASENYTDVELNKEIQGELGSKTVAAIDRIVRDLRAHRRSPDHGLEMKEIMKADSGTRKASVRVIADLFIGDFRSGPLFAEIKTPLPNLDICAETKSKILTFEALLHARHPRGYLAFPYNPFITRAAYAHSFTKRIMDMQAEVLIADEFWDTIGGKGTFADLLEIIETVGDELRVEKTKGAP